MTAALLVLIALACVVLALVMLTFRFLWWLALPVLILGVLVSVAEGPHAAADLWGERLDGVVVATQESVRVETARASGTRTSRQVVRHRYGLIVCYRAPDAPGLGAGAPLDPAIRAAVGEPASEADRLCQQAPGDGVLRQVEVRLDEAAHDAARPGRPVRLKRLRPFGLLEWTWPVDAPLLPMLPRPSFGRHEPPMSIPAQVMAVTIDTKGRGLLIRRARAYAVPVAYVRLRYVAPGHPDGVEGVDRVDAPSVSDLTAGSPVVVTITADAPRAPRLVGAERSYWWRNVRDDLLIIIAMIGIAILIAGVLKRRSRG